jgi:hypothetical protein
MPNTPSSQLCTKCGKELPLSDFATVKTGPSAGRTFRQCKSCQYIAKKARQAANPDLYRERARRRQARWRAANPDRARELNRNQLRKMRVDQPELFRQYEKDRFVRDKEKRQALSRAGERRVRREILLAYGHRCVCCGIKNEEFLTVDHIRGNGKSHRKSVGSGLAFYRWLRREQYPKDFRLLCHFCNAATHWFSQCPHQSGMTLDNHPGRPDQVRLRKEVLLRYGGRCTCCGETRLIFLTIDHTDGGHGRSDKRDRRDSGSRMYQRLRREGYPQEGYRVLCLNCNCAYGFYGYCPHG